MYIALMMCQSAAIQATEQAEQARQKIAIPTVEFLIFQGPGAVFIFWILQLLQMSSSPRTSL
jgi:hypothetical protein